MDNCELDRDINYKVKHLISMNEYILSILNNIIDIISNLEGIEDNIVQSNVSSTVIHTASDSRPELVSRRVTLADCTL